MQWKYEKRRASTAYREEQPGELPTKNPAAKRACARSSWCMEAERCRPRLRPTDKQIRPVDWEVYSALITLRVNSQVPKYDGFTPRRRVFGRTPKMPLGAAGNPIFCDFTNQDRPPSDTDASCACEADGIEKSLFRNRRPAKFVKSTGSGNGEAKTSFYGELYISITIRKEVKMILNDKDMASI